MFHTPTEKAKFKKARISAQIERAQNDRPFRRKCHNPKSAYYHGILADVSGCNQRSGNDQHTCRGCDFWGMKPPSDDQHPT